MADLMKDANYLRFYYTSEAMNLDKDLCKNDAYRTYQRRCYGLMAIPFGLTIWQINLLGKSEAWARTWYNIRFLKLVATGGALAMCFKEMLDF